MLPVRSRFLASLVIGLALVPCIAVGQVTTSTVSGTVKDAQGGVIPGVSVVLTSDTRGGLQVGEAVTDAQGNFVFPGTMPDTYSVTVKLEGFKTSKVSSIAVERGRPHRAAAVHPRGRHAGRDRRRDGRRAADPGRER